MLQRHCPRPSYWNVCASEIRAGHEERDRGFRETRVTLERCTHFCDVTCNATQAQTCACRSRRSCGINNHPVTSSLIHPLCSDAPAIGIPVFNKSTEGNGLACSGNARRRIWTALRQLILMPSDRRCVTVCALALQASRHPITAHDTHTHTDTHTSTHTNTHTHTHKHRTHTTQNSGKKGCLCMLRIFCPDPACVPELPTNRELQEKCPFPPPLSDLK